MMPNRERAQRRRKFMSKYDLRTSSNMVGFLRTFHLPPIDISCVNNSLIRSLIRATLQHQHNRLHVSLFGREFGFSTF